MQILQILEAAAKVVKGKVWGVDIGKPRIYMFCPRRDAKVFFDFPEHTDDVLGKAVLKCAIADNGWHGGRWYIAQKEIILEHYERHFAALNAFFAGDEELAAELMGRKKPKRVFVKKGKTNASV